MINPRTSVRPTTSYQHEWPTTNVYDEQERDKGDIHDDSYDRDMASQYRTAMTGIKLTKVPISLSLGRLLPPTFTATVDSRSL